MRRAAAQAARWLHQGARLLGADTAAKVPTSSSANPLEQRATRSIASSPSRAAAAAADASPSPPSPLQHQQAPLTEQSPFWTLCGVVAVGVSAAAVGQRAAAQDARAARAELRNAAAEAYAAERARADAPAKQLAAVEAAARRELEQAGEAGRGAARPRPWREVSEELWAAMSEGGRS